jgi:hypothetical protein
LAAALSGLLMIVPSRAAARAVSLVALLAGVWLIAGPTLHAVWSTRITPITTAEPDQALRWIAYFFGPGVLLTYLSGSVQGLFAARTRRPEPAVEPAEPAVPAEPDVDERERSLTVR